jgi:uncharacterized protein YbbC (DUF1343 family)/CubicO group peptidase (beta-lactamase class C family)
MRYLSERAERRGICRCDGRLLLVVLAVVAAAGMVRGQERPGAGKSAKLAGLDSILKDSVAAGEFPGAVVLVGQSDRTLCLKALGERDVLPQHEPMSVRTIFDLASLTKVVATAPVIMRLVEEGKLRLNDPVQHYLPEFTGGGKDQITLRMLLTHTSGLRPDPPAEVDVGGRDAVIKFIYGDALVAPPGSQFIYSDTGYVVLGELAQRVTGKSLDVLAQETVFGPLGMRHTRFLPPSAWIPRIAPTEEIDLPAGMKAGSGQGRVVRGVVHDPTARALGGVAGDAGVFSTAGDLAIFCRMMLEGGRIPGGAGKRMLSEEAVHKMTTPQSPPWLPDSRGLGWDIDSGYSSPRGEFFPLSSYGHTGFTGTSLWLDPASKVYVILLSNSVHPYARTGLISLRSRVATLAAAALGAGTTEGSTSPIERGVGAARRYEAGGILRTSDQTLAGIDVLEAQGFEPLRGKRVGLIANQTSVDASGQRTADALFHAPGVRLVALFSPEHGSAGQADARIDSSKDAATGLPIYSLYGATLRPTDEMLQGIDALVFDIQDAGVRFYTFTTTMGYAMEESARRHIVFYVLDRPNPLGGEIIEGPMLDSGRISFVGYFPMPVRYGMTIGELAQMFNAENHIGGDVHVVAMRNWRRGDFYEATGQRWIAPSPNLRTIDAAMLYPGIEILQAGGVSVGRGTDTTFEVFGAPWIDATALARELNRRFIPGVRFVPIEFTPQAGANAGPNAGVVCNGVSVLITDRDSLRPMLMGLEVEATLHRMYGQSFALHKTIELLGSESTIERLERGDSPERIVWDWEDALDQFRKMREKYLIGIYN